MKKYNLVYKITNSINNMIYIGVHSTDIIDDGYMGSGSFLKKDIKKFGVKSFNREILFNFNSRDEALNKEKEIVNFDFLKSDKVYNLITGGGDGIRTIKEKRQFFNKKANKVKINETVKIDYSPVDNQYIYIIKPKGDFPLIDENLYQFTWQKTIIGFLNKYSWRFYRSISYCFNDINYKEKATELINKMNQFSDYHDNWVIKKHKVDLSFWDELNKDENYLNQFYSR